MTIFSDKYSKLFIITINHCNAGFFAHLIFVVNQLIYCERQHYFPIVYFGPWSLDGPNPFYDPAYGENIWEYFFEPVTEYSSSEIQEMVKSPDNPLSIDNIEVLASEELWYLHAGCPDSVYTYPYGYAAEASKKEENWYDKQRQKVAQYVERYVRVKPEILKEVDTFTNQHFANHHVLGIHIRGTDKGSAGSEWQLMRIIKPQEYFACIDAYTKENGACKIFVATDQRQFLGEMRNRYGDRIIAYDAIRSSSTVNTFQKSEGKNYQKGKDVLIDALLLSHCNFLLKCTSAVGESAMYFNPSLRCIDLNTDYTKASYLDYWKVKRARFKIPYKQYKLSKEIQLSSTSESGFQKLLNHFIISSPLFFWIQNEAESRRYSKRILSYCLVFIKDVLFKLFFLDKTPWKLLIERLNHQWLRRGSQVYNPVAASGCKYLEICIDWDLELDIVSILLSILRQLRVAEIHGLIPVMNINWGLVLKHSPVPEDDVWEEYFEPVSGVASDELIGVPCTEIMLLSSSQQMSIDIGLDFPVPKDKSFLDEVQLYRQNQLGAKLIRDYFRCKESIVLTMDKFYADRISGEKVLGIHNSYLDREESNIGNFDAYYWPITDKYLTHFPNGKIFVADGQNSSIETFIDRYGDSVIYYNVEKSLQDSLHTNLLNILLLSKLEVVVTNTEEAARLIKFFKPSISTLNISGDCKFSESIFQEIG